MIARDVKVYSGLDHRWSGPPGAPSAVPGLPRVIPGSEGLMAAGVITVNRDTKPGLWPVMLGMGLSSAT
jgi:hypothetical protein